MIPPSPISDVLRNLTRRTFIGQSARGVGGIALGTLLASGLAEAATEIGRAHV